MISKDLLLQCSRDIGIELSSSQLEQFDLYAKTLVEWNKKINLTTIIEPDEIVIKHFVDSISVLSVLNIKENATLIDVGTGAGFPSLPLAIIRPDLRVTQLDSLQKRINFLNEIANLLDLDIKTIHMRAEDGGRNTELREKFDYVTARAVSQLNVLSEYCLPFLKKGGSGFFLKGFEIDTELNSARRAVKLLGCKVENVEKIVLPQNNKRSIVIVKKISQTSSKYPRIAKKIKENPL